MESVRSLAGPVPALQVRERTGGRSKQQADAFRRALQQGQEGEQAAAEGEGQAPLRTGLQQKPPIGRRDEQNAHHVDVLA